LKVAKVCPVIRIGFVADAVIDQLLTVLSSVLEIQAADGQKRDKSTKFSTKSVENLISCLHKTERVLLVRHEVAYVIVLIDDLVKIKPAVPSAVEDNTRNGILRTLSYFLRLSQVVPIKPSPQNSTGIRIPSWQNSGSFIDSFKWDIFDVSQYLFKIQVKFVSEHKRIKIIRSFKCLACVKFRSVCCPLQDKRSYSLWN
jgi:hypothetical protein